MTATPTSEREAMRTLPDGSLTREEVNELLDDLDAARDQRDAALTALRLSARRQYEWGLCWCEEPIDRPAPAYHSLHCQNGNDVLRAGGAS